MRLRWASEIAALSLLVTTGCAPTIYPVDRAPNWVMSTGDWIAPPEDFAACFQGAHSQLQLLEACMLARGYRIRRAGDRAYAVPGPNAWFIKVAPDSNYPGATTGFAGVKGVAFYSRDECASWKAPASLTVLSGCHAVVVLNRPTTDSVSTAIIYQQSLDKQFSTARQWRLNFARRRLLTSGISSYSDSG